jgi:hypothetical protein
MRKIFQKDREMKFQTSVKNLPEKIKTLRIPDYTIIDVEIKVTQNQVVSVKHTKNKSNLLQELLKNPIKVDGFKPFSRDEIYNR